MSIFNYRVSPGPCHEGQREWASEAFCFIMNSGKNFMTQRTECSGGKWFLIFSSKTWAATGNLNCTPAGSGTRPAPLRRSGRRLPCGPRPACPVPAPAELLVCVCGGGGGVVALHRKDWVENELGFRPMQWLCSPRTWREGSVMLRGVRCMGRWGCGVISTQFSTHPGNTHTASWWVPLPPGPVVEPLPGRWLCSKGERTCLSFPWWASSSHCFNTNDCGLAASICYLNFRVPGEKWKKVGSGLIWPEEDGSDAVWATWAACSLSPASLPASNSWTKGW